MIVVNAVVEVEPGNLDPMRDAIASMENASRAEDGCVDYTFSVELQNPNVIRITECWESMAALTAHFATPHMAAFQGAMGAHPPKRVEARFFDATEVSPPGMGG